MVNKILIIIIAMLQNISIFSQRLNTNNCNIPYHITTESLYNLILSKSGASKDKIIMKKIEDLRIGIHLDSLMNNLQDSIISKIGEKLFCENLSLKYDCFHFPSNCDTRNIIMRINYNFKLPQIKNDTNEVGNLDYSVSVQCFFYRKNPNTPIETSIYYLPKCIGTDCGFRVTKNEAINLAKLSGLIKEGDKFQIKIVPYSWEITKGLAHINIDLISGKVSKIIKLERKDNN